MCTSITIQVAFDIVPREARPEAERSEVTNRVVFGLITWFAGPGKSSREFVYIYIYFQGVCSRSRDICTSLSRTSSTKFLRLEGFKMVHAKYC